MSNQDHREKEHTEHHSTGEEIRHMIIDRLKALWNWYTPHKDDSVFKKIIITLLKTPVMLLVILFSPVALIILLFTFIAAF